MTIENFLKEYGTLLDTNQGAFFLLAEHKLNILDYEYLMQYIKKAEVVLDPKNVFQDFKSYKLCNQPGDLETFLIEKFSKDISDFDGMNLKNIPLLGSYLRINNTQIRISNGISNNFIVADASVEINYLNHIGDMANCIKIYMHDKRNSPCTFQMEVFNNFIVVPNYGIGYNEDKINNSINHFIEMLKAHFQDN